MAVPKLDKDHGFIRFIVNNQIDRDNYDQEQKVITIKNRCNQRNNRQLRKDRPTYVAPAAKNENRSSIEARSSSKQANMPNVSEAGTIGQPPRSSDTVASESKILFEMEYVPKNSNPVVVAIFQNSTPERIVEKISEKCSMSVKLKQALHKRIVDEIKAAQ